MFQEYFSRIADLRARGWYELHPERVELDWLCKHYPAERAKSRSQKPLAPVLRGEGLG